MKGGLLISRMINRRSDLETDGINFIIGLVVVAFFVIVGLCIYKEVTEPKSGTIISKQYHAPYTSYETETYTDYGGMTRSRSYPVHHDASYLLIYESNGETGDAYVDDHTYHEYNKGDFFDQNNY